ncbi:leucine-rich repeat protein [Skeletonema marinoi]|uniref:Leucine-rich repeat protein n=1 Tax=Skeletonema marinoi TaxID=267567 RepID=A0AAD8XRP0_9STRA|nr:leucine-rich repeat protein [Skeletonema marinoi]
MDVQDCKYYEARAKDVNLEDITSSEQNAAILARLRDNDLTFTAISIEDGPQVESDFVVREGDSMGWLGYFVGRSKQVETLSIYSFPDSLNIDAFLRGLGHNRSIQSLHINIDLGENFQSLVPLLENDSNLSRLTFDNFIGLQCAHNIALMLGQQSTLKYLNFEETNLMDEMLVEIVAALSSQPQLEELDLGYNNIGRDGCVALGNVLQGLKNPNLTNLHLENNAIDDEGLHALVSGLKNCHNLTSFHLHGNQLITEAGLRSLSALFQSDSCRLEHLDLDELNIDDDGVSILAAGLVSLSTLKRLHISDNSIGDEGLQALLVGGLASLNLEELHLSRNSFSPSGLRSLRNWVQSATRLNALSVCNNNINDEGLHCLVEGITNCCSLKTLGLSYNRLITSAGLRSLAPFFQSDNCCMKELSLWGYILVTMER